jgi:hypothetical protein
MPIKSPYGDEDVIHIEGNEFKGIPDFDIEQSDIWEYVHDNMVIKTTDGVHFECVFNTDQLALYKFIGVYNWVTDYCPNRRVVHLIKYGKTKRVREKNFTRACKILEKELRK